MSLNDLEIPESVDSLITMNTNSRLASTIGLFQRFSQLGVRKIIMEVDTGSDEITFDTVIAAREKALSSAQNSANLFALFGGGPHVEEINLDVFLEI